MMKHRLLLVWAAAALLAGGARSEGRFRTPIHLPDIPGYLTLKCDFHMHTVFSDGRVWPDVRAEEAWRQGLDAIAITDHIEYQPHQGDIPTKHNRSYQIAKSAGDPLDIIVIHGSEITRKMPPGHLNAIFLTDSEPLDTPKWQDAVRAAAQQGAFIFWNHPGWKAQQPDGVARWYPEHEALVKAGQLNGIEVVNTRSYYPEAHRWCLERNLTMLSNSDIHPPICFDYDLAAGEHRPLTLVFATERSPGGIKEALFAHRTAVYSGNRLIGREQFLRPIFERSVTIVNPERTIRGKGRGYVQLRNTSDLDYELERTGTVDGLTIPGSLVLPAGKTALLEVRGQGKIKTGVRQFALPYRVKNLLIAPDEGLPVKLAIQVTFLPVSSK
jgi:hypothetical protein